MTQIFESIVLGLAQGLTEFLPVSSSGHLVLLGNLFHFQSPGALFETVLHMGTVFAVVYFYRKKLVEIIKKDFWLIIIGTIPAGLIGILAREPIEALFSSTKLVGVALLVTALINYATDKQEGRKENLDIVDSIVIGIAQAFAIIPGISRSGSTILAGTSMKVDRARAAEFSFILSIPAIVGANLVELVSHGFDGSLSIMVYGVGFIAAFVSGVFAIGLLIRILRERHFKYFSLYCLALGLITIFFL